MQPLISVIVPVHDGAKFLPRCLEALTQPCTQPHELIVIDDGSNDDSARTARDMGARVFSLSRQSGPAEARNIGAQMAVGEILLFVDADVVVQSGTLERVTRDFEEHPDIAAVFGSYDDEPAEKNFFSQYKNLFHHFVHQQSNTEAGSFWAGCGAVRRDVFLAVGGFDAERYPRPAIEDIELGYRMGAMGHRILLDKELQGKHLKQWTLRSLLKADIFCRAVPWSILILESKGMVNDLNLRTGERLSAGLVALTLCVMAASFLKPGLLLLIPLLLMGLIVLNHKFYRFFIRKRGLRFAILVLPLHYLYYCYSGFTFVAYWCRHFFQLRDLPRGPAELDNHSRRL